ncbi:MAG TPA: DinB family protein [Ktedonobacterales bacterium]|nr:DinB family protein [Ktedonobacterales bacterium]
MTSGVADFFKHNLWANLRLLDACAQLSDAQLDAAMNGTFGSARQTLMHLLAVEEGFARLCTGTAPVPPLKEGDTFPGFDELRRRAEQSGNRLIAFAEQADMSQSLQLAGRNYKTPVMVVLIQVINHAMEHRSQVATLLSQQGIELPSLDGLSYGEATR